MDFNGFLLSAMMIRGRFDAKTIHERKFRVYMNHVLGFIQFFCGIKMLIVLVLPWNDEAPLLFYLVEFFVFPCLVQRALFAAVAGIHLHIAYIYWIWNQLSADAKHMHYLKMLFMPNLRRLCRYYGLPTKKTKKFLQRIQIYKSVMILIIVGFEFCFYMLVGRCLYFSYFTIPTYHFVSIALPMGIITLFGYHWLANGFLVGLLLAFVTISFLGLRMNTISDRIRLKLDQPVNGRQHRLLLLKDQKDMLEIMQTINDIVKQYKETNRIFEHLISPTYANCLLGALVYPAFLFFNIPYFFKVLIIVLYVGAVGVNCLLITIFNEGFIRNASLTE